MHDTWCTVHCTCRVEVESGGCGGNKVKLIDRHTSVALCSFGRPSHAPALPCCSFAFIRSTIFLLQQPTLAPSTGQDRLPFFAWGLAWRVRTRKGEKFAKARRLGCVTGGRSPLCIYCIKDDNRFGRRRHG